MCIISKSIKKVSSTKILCAMSIDKSRQLTVYSNTVYNTESGNVMILPVPNIQSIQFHDLIEYPDIFADCVHSMVTPASPKYLLLDDDAEEEEEYLPVMTVGSFQVSVINDLNDLHHIDPTLCILDDTLLSFLSYTYNSENIGFIVCKLVEGNEKYHPMAYSHDKVDNIAFVPNMHYHTHSKKIIQGEFDDEFESAYEEEYKNDLKQSPEHKDDWDHEIYLYNITSRNFGTDKARVEQSYDPIQNKTTYKTYIKHDTIDFPLGPVKAFKRITIHVEYPNQDVKVPINV